MGADYPHSAEEQTKLAHGGCRVGVYSIFQGSKKKSQTLKYSHSTEIIQQHLYCFFLCARVIYNLKPQICYSVLSMIEDLVKSYSTEKRKTINCITI